MKKIFLDISVRLSAFCKLTDIVSDYALLSFLKANESLKFDFIHTNSLSVLVKSTRYLHMVTRFTIFLFIPRCVLSIHSMYRMARHI